MTAQNKWQRIWRHWLHPRWRVAKHFPDSDLVRLSSGIGGSEKKHTGQIRFVIESNMDVATLWRETDPRTRAWQWFGELGVWDTAENCGVLVYVSFADHRVEIVADRGIAARVSDSEWQDVCDAMLFEFGQQHFVSGLQLGLTRTTDILAQHFPRHELGHDELSNEVVLK